MKNIITLILFLISFLPYNAQIISLDQISQCENINCPEYSSIKDISNRLDKFVGTWKGSFTDGRTYEFHFIKKSDFSLYGEKPWDLLIGKILVKDNNGNILETTINLPDDSTHFNGYLFDKNLKGYKLYYSGNAECNDKGFVYIYFKEPSNLSQLSLMFLQDYDIVANCPNGYKTIMPNNKIIRLIKQ
ncbi:DUF6705 family protein [Chryseobacterium cheonjiense]|uniref:DUF6705 domain-containing protein n=1 Tax=Chryseobacterium cheonjiense TaxID=2728845 RepID=A0A7Y0A8J3_9FLAO|nr:DUF6705 family protein [Chryseobacterium cheonjiense]NML58641.1 hypothetical protein [Chryseobacterium cheonjiense]